MRTLTLLALLVLFSLAVRADYDGHDRGHEDRCDGHNDNCHGKRGPQGPPGRNGAHGATGPTGPNYVYGQDRFVDPINGNDANNGGVASPYRTIARALVDASAASQIHPWNIHLFPGPANEDVNWLPWVSLLGTTKFSASINGNFRYIGPAYTDLANPIRFDIQNVRILGTTTVDLTANTAVIIHFNNVFFTGLFTLTAPNDYLANFFDVFLFDSILGNADINGPLEVLSSLIAGTVTIRSGQSPPFIQAVGSILQGPIALEGNAQLWTVGCELSSTITSTPLPGAIPIWFSSSDSLGLAVLAPGNPVQLVDLDNKVAGLAYPPFAPGDVSGPGKVVTDFTVTIESFVAVDTTAGPITITIPPASQYTGRQLAITKVAGASIVTIATSDGSLINGSPTAILILQFSSRILISNSNAYSIISLL